VLADQTQLVQLFQNLVANSLKFRAERPPRIHVGARRTATLQRLLSPTTASASNRSTWSAYSGWANACTACRSTPATVSVGNLRKDR